MQAFHGDICATWERIHRVLREHSPATERTFNAPATDAEIKSLEDLLALDLPEDYRQSLQVHNGQTDPYRLSGLSLDGILMDTRAVADVWKMCCSVDEHWRKHEPNWDKDVEWWNPKWVPFTDNQSGDFLCINMDADLCPIGQLVYHVHDNPFYAAKWPSFGAWLEEIAVKLEKGQVKSDGDRLRVLEDSELGA